MTTEDVLNKLNQLCPDAEAFVIIYNEKSSLKNFHIKLSLKDRGEAYGSDNIIDKAFEEAEKELYKLPSIKEMRKEKIVALEKELSILKNETEL